MKKHSLWAVGLLLLACTWDAGLLAQDLGGYVKYSGSPNPGVIVVVSNGFGKDIRKSNANAFAGAFYALLFRGIPGSAYELPMVPNETQMKANSVITALLDGGYNAFVMEDNMRDEIKTTKKKDGANGISTTHLITINCDALRRYLEERSVIRKFGN